MHDSKNGIAVQAQYGMVGMEWPCALALTSRPVPSHLDGGELAEWSKAGVLKTSGSGARVGSNPTLASR